MARLCYSHYSLELQVRGCRSGAAGRGLLVGGCRSGAAGQGLPVGGTRLHANTRAMQRRCLWHSGTSRSRCSGTTWQCADCRFVKFIYSQSQCRIVFMVPRGAVVISDDFGMCFGLVDWRQGEISALGNAVQDMPGMHGHAVVGRMSHELEMLRHALHDPWA